MDYEGLENKLKKRKWLFIGVSGGVVVIAIALMCLFGFVLDNRIALYVCIAFDAVGIVALYLSLRIKIKTVEAEGQHITVFGFFGYSLYVDGKEQGRVSCLGLGEQSLEGQLSNGTKFTLFVSNMFARIVFSDNNSVEL